MVPMRPAAHVLDADLLRAFVAFSETLNFTQAAPRVHLSQPAFFGRIQRLTEILETALYERAGAGRALTLTEAGRRLAAFARESLARTDAFVDELHGEARRETVVLAAGEGAFLYCLGPALEQIARGAIDLRPLTLGAKAAAEAVKTGEADLAFTVLDVVPHGLVADEILRFPMCAAVPARHRLAKRPRLEIADLAGERLILPPSGRLYRDLVARFVARTGQDVLPPLEADGWPLMLGFVRARLGIAVVNGSCAAQPGVVQIPIPELGSVRYVLIRRRGATLDGAALRVAEHIRTLAVGAPRPGERRAARARRSRSPRARR